MSKKFKPGCSYQVKPKYYDKFGFNYLFYKTSTSYIFTVSRVDESGNAWIDGHCIALKRERKMCKRIYKKGKSK